MFGWGSEEVRFISSFGIGIMSVSNTLTLDWILAHVRWDREGIPSHCTPPQ